MLNRMGKTRSWDAIRKAADTGLTREVDAQQLERVLGGNGPNNHHHDDDWCDRCHCRRSHCHCHH